MESERRALLAIKSDMYDPGDWFSSWTGKDCCGWRGVACDHSTGHVTKLDLRCPYRQHRDLESIGGSKVNPSLQELKNLTYLDLSMNNFSGAPVPKMIASLVHLEYLDLSYAMFDGLIPPQFGNLSKLHHLDLGGWYDDHLHVDDLDWLTRIPSLKYLDMSFVNLSKATNWFHVINSIPTLEVLYLYYADLPYVPSPLPPFNLTAIANLSLSGNSNITSAMLRWLSNATSLEYLVLSGCGTSLGNLTNLQHLDLGYNLISGEIPPTVGNFVQLEYLDLSNNSITGEIPSSIGNLTNLVHLDLSSNNIIGHIPPNLGNLTKLISLHLRSNNIIGSIPEAIGDLQNLQFLYLGGNAAVTGQIPKMIGRLHRLRQLDMSYNNLSGQIPMTMGGLCNLTFLFLSHNNLSGIIPTIMGQLSRLYTLDLSSNLLEGNITEAHFSNLTSLSELTIASNSLNTQQQLQDLYLSGVGISGSLPVWFLDFSKGLRELNLSSNHLTGPLPSAPQFVLDLSNNSFVGPIPLDFAKAINLFLLSSSHNHINGDFPPFFCNMDSLGILDLSNNHLIEKIPECHNSFPTNLLSLHLNNNNLSGRIPSFLKHCNQLIYLDIGENKLFGKIPIWIGRNLLSLKFLSLRSNFLYGTIPMNIVNITSLQILDLSSNNLTGSLPSSLGNFKAMVEIQNDTRSMHHINYYMIQYDTRSMLNIDYYYQESILLTTKRLMVEYTTILLLMTSIDISNNHLSGEIPKELTKLLELRFINLSRNHLTGRIPEKIGDMKQLESLDLSINSLTGEIPSSFSVMNFLDYLNLSYNNLSGKIPMSSQLSTFDSWTYVGNKDLCGTPLPDCPVYQTPLDARDKDDEKLDKLLECTSIVIATSSADAGVKLEEDDDGDMLETIILDVTSVVVGFIVVSEVSIGGISSSCMESERRALLAIKSDMYDPGDRFSSWTGKDCCGWRGVACDNTTGHVTKLDLRYPYTYDIWDGNYPYIYDLWDLIYNEERIGVSKVNPSLQELKHLKYLDLSMNNFSHAPLPKMIASLVHLEYLNLSYAMFHGPIPPQLGNLSNLHYLDLQGWYDYHLHVVDLDWLSRIPSLKYLDMSEVNLSKAINWFYVINSIPALEVLRLSDADLPCVPSPLPPFNLTAITTLDLSGNSNITSAMLRWLSNATSLEYLLLSGCGKTIGGLLNLQMLSLSNNLISGQVPNTIGRIHRLQLLDMSYNNLSGQIPTTLGDLCNLTRLDLSCNNIGGDLTNLFYGLSTCSQGASISSLDLVLKGNNLSGIIPSIMGQLSQLYEIDLSSNSLAGNITEAHFLNLTSLWKFKIASNSLNVMLPNDWRPPFSASIIDMSFCHLGEKFPDWIQTQQRLQNLYLSGVGVSGGLPVWFLDFSKGLLELNLSSNHLMGPLPSAPQVMLDLSNNSFVGPIPPSFAKATNLFLLILSHNYINGSLPPFFCNMHSLGILDLSNNHLIGKVPECHYSFPTFLQSLHLNSNNLSGTIPSFLKYCHQLITLDLGENKLHGKIPTWMGRNLLSLKFLRLRSNLLYGTILENIVDLTSLQVLDLSSNNLTGSLPSSLGNFSAMVEIQNDTWSFHEGNYSNSESIIITTKGLNVDYTTILSLVTCIDLSNNHLSGEIPKELTKLLGLRFLNLSNNHLTGMIPENIGDMKLLESLDLSENSLTGEIPSSFSTMYFLARLNLSYNNLSGKIPTSGQLSTFDSWTYVGNKELCGTPLPACPVYQTPLDAKVKDDEKLEKLLEYTSIVVGFVVGFWLFIGTLIMKQAIRFAFFRRIDKTSDWIYVQFVVKLAKLKSKWQTMT
ncbi:unnamed protein product [Musa textilis]